MRREVALGSALGTFLTVLAILVGLAATALWVSWVDYGSPGLGIVERLLAVAEWLLDNWRVAPPWLPLPTDWDIPTLYGR